MLENLDAMESIRGEIIRLVYAILEENLRLFVFVS
jgi:hypothetical protein